MELYVNCKKSQHFKAICEPSFDAHLKNQITISLSWKKALKSSSYHLEKPWVAPERETSLFIRQKHWLCLSYHLMSPNHPWQLSRASQFAFFLMVTYPCSQVPCHTQHKEATFVICWHRWGGLGSSLSHHKGCLDESLSLGFFSWIWPRIIHLKIIWYLSMLLLLY